jgi:ATP-dependent Clp protease ATP-binding subunit ClpX
VSLDNLDRDALVRILTEPKNAIIKQYQKLMHLDRAELVFTDDALEAAADSALKQKTGARGLRTIIEDVLLDVMFEIPSRGDVKKVIIDGETIARRKSAQLVTRGEARAVELEDESA